MEIVEVYNKVINLWKKYPISHRVPMFYPDLKSEPLLFIGLNPSFREKEFKRLLTAPKYEYILSDLQGYFNFNNFNLNPA